MKSTRGLLSLLLALSLGFISFMSLPTQHVIAQESNTALQRGYRTGYSDGYMAGYRDSLDGKTKDFSQQPDYAKASRAYSKDYGPIEDYRDGYKQGFEGGYDAGFEKKSFDSEIPAGLEIRSSTDDPAPSAVPLTKTELPAPQPSSQPISAEATPPSVTTPPEQTATVTTSQPVAIATTDGTITIPKDTELILELQNELSTNKNQAGDKFTAKVISPLEF